MHPTHAATSNGPLAILTEALLSLCVLKATPVCLPAGDDEVGKELWSKYREHTGLAADARSRANASAYKAHNAGITNRWKVSSDSSCLLAHV